jgi:hypothetical protein
MSWEMVLALDHCRLAVRNTVLSKVIVAHMPAYLPLIKQVIAQYALLESTVTLNAPSIMA